jgi:hypothetical protein
MSRKATSPTWDCVIVGGVLGHDGLDPPELRARGRAELAGYGVEVATAPSPSTPSRRPPSTASTPQATAPSPGTAGEPHASDEQR